jgi:7-cyano-7-deazaguanine synthase
VARKFVVLLSAGLDSTVNFYAAKNEGDVAMALTFDYGQRAAKKEIEHAAEISRRGGVPHRVLALPWFRDFTKTSLVDTSMAIPTGKAKSVSIDDMNVSAESAKAVWVPNRNGIFLNIAAAFAEGLGADAVVPGFNLEEAATFPDNSEDYLLAASESFRFSTSNQVKVHCFTSHMMKSEIVALGRRLGVPFDLIWTCYFGGDAPCGECESCLRFKRAKDQGGET